MRTIHFTQIILKAIKVKAFVVYIALSSAGLHMTWTAHRINFECRYFEGCVVVVMVLRTSHYIYTNGMQVKTFKMLLSIIYFFIFRFMWFMIKVTFGEHDRCNDSVRPETRFVLRAIAQQFSFTNFDNDIALLRLNDRVPITDFIRPICLPEKPGMFLKYNI